MALTMTVMTALLLAAILLLSSVVLLAVAKTGRHTWKSWTSMVEADRKEQFLMRYEWPENRPVVPNTTGWQELHDRRFNQVRQIEHTGQRYDGFVQTTASAFTQKNFTEFGWGLTKAPPRLLQMLQKGIRDGLDDFDNSVRSEGDVDVIDGLPPWFIDRPDMMNRAMYGLQDIHEAWSGQPLVPYRAYGFRLYRNQSSLLMHVDKSNTHIISCILHIDSSEDAEPWPIVIEDLHGNTHQVILTPGDMLLYESSKCFHGRPQRFNGSWYSSVFIHYYPDTDEWKSVNHEFEIHYSVALDWYKAPSTEEKKHETLEMRGTSMREPECEHGWCALKDAIHWKGPAMPDIVMTTGGKHYPLYPNGKQVYKDTDDGSKDEL